MQCISRSLFLFRSQLLLDNCVAFVCRQMTSFAACFVNFHTHFCVDHYEKRRKCLKMDHFSIKITFDVHLFFTYLNYSHALFANGLLFLSIQFLNCLFQLTFTGHLNLNSISFLVHASGRLDDFINWHTCFTVCMRNMRGNDIRKKHFRFSSIWHWCGWMRVENNDDDDFDIVYTIIVVSSLFQNEITHCRQCANERIHCFVQGRFRGENDNRQMRISELIKWIIYAKFVISWLCLPRNEWKKNNDELPNK